MVHAEAIRLHAKRAASDIVEIGERLNAVRGRIGHGDWLPWLDREFSWSEQSARRFVQVAKAFKSLTVSDLEIDATALYQRSASVVSGNVASPDR
jgi:hypothetical protein